uniref:Uncharacterized protein n=1 Tax=Anguilla anguilla TaxID=7936 RepID=A0A0E9RE05_ANGAN
MDVPVYDCFIVLEELLTGPHRK